MGSMVYNVNNTATQILAAKQIKENIFLPLLHRNGKGVNEQTETNASTIRMFKIKEFDDDARTLGSNTNGANFNNATAGAAQVIEYDLNLLHIYDKVYDLPEVQQDMCPVSIFEGATTNIGGRIATEINASTIAYQLANRYNQANADNAWSDVAVLLGATPNYYESYMDASAKLDDGDSANGIASFPFTEREFLMTSAYRKGLMSAKGVLVGGSNYAQSMLAKGAISPEAEKEFGTMYVGELDNVPCYLVPDTVLKRAGRWAGDTASATTHAFDGVKALLVAASATDRGISTQDYVKVIDSPNGAGKRLQPKTRWGVNVCYGKGIVPILANGTAVPTADLTIVAPGSQS